MVTLGLVMFGLVTLGLVIFGLVTSGFSTADWLSPFVTGDPPMEPICTTFTGTLAEGLVEVTKTLRETDENAGMEISSVMS